AETLWAPAGYVIASEQFALHNTAGLAMPKLETQPAPAITQQKGMIVVTSLDEKYQWCWDSQTGLMINWQVDDKTQMLTAPQD
ncbi:hypothetical protein EA007_25200, partial [Vibrio anguillarum]|uniref:hypothetical protein n=1 Tax=Vibrio anguillarum TaxID=55601 RepID=UPI00188B3CE5